MYKTFYLACILGCAIAEDMMPEMKTKEGADLAAASSGDIEAAGKIYEVWAQGKDQEDNEFTAIAFSMGWETMNEAAPFENGSWTQNWAQWEDPDAPGTFWNMSCNVKFDSSVEMAKPENVYVRGMKGSNINAATVTTGGPLAIGTLTEEWGPTAEGFGW